MGGEEQAPGRVEASRWLVDGFNVLQVGVLRGRDRSDWWRGERRAELLARVASFRARERPDEVLVVFDGEHAPPSPDPAEVPVVFAPSADEWLVAAVRQADCAEAIAVVTADRRLADRVRRRGARVVTPQAFLARCG